MFQHLHISFMSGCESVRGQDSWDMTGLGAQVLVWWHGGHQTVTPVTTTFQHSICHGDTCQWPANHETRRTFQSWREAARKLMVAGKVTEPCNLSWLANLWLLTGMLPGDPSCLCLTLRSSLTFTLVTSDHGADTDTMELLYWPVLTTHPAQLCNVM